MFWLATAFYLIWYGFTPKYWSPNGLSWYSVVMTALFVNGYNPEYINGLVPGGWSIAVEVNFYLVFPALLAVTRSLPRSIALIAVALGMRVVANKLFGVIFADAFSPNQGYIVEAFRFFNFFNQLPVFAAGIASYFIITSPRLSRAASVSGAAALLGVAVLIIVFRSQAFRYLSAHLMLTAIVFSAMAITLYNFPVKVFVNKPIQYLGQVSFSLYLVHFAVLFYLEKYGVKSLFHSGNVASLAYFALVLACGSVLASLFHVGVEKPGVRLGTRLIRRLEFRSSTGVPAGDPAR